MSVRRLLSIIIAALLLPLPALLLAASAPPLPSPEPLDRAWKRAHAEARAAEAQQRRLEEAARSATDEAARLRAGQLAAAQAIAAAEARINAAEAQMRILSARTAERRARLQREQAPAASLLTGLALMAERPPLVAIADRASVEEFVRIRILLDSTLPQIRARTAALSREVAEGRQLQESSARARNELVQSRDALDRRRREFAALEQSALDMAQLSGSEALGAGDVTLARSEQAEALLRQSRIQSSGARLAAELARLGPAPPRPSPPDSAAARPPFPYMLPARAAVTQGLGDVSESGIRSRGLTLGTPRGATLAVPADGIVRFAGPFRRFDGIIIIDHGRGWVSLILNASSLSRPGDRVKRGTPLGRALGPVGVELSHNGRHRSAALIAGSSALLSNGRKGG